MQPAQMQHSLLDIQDSALLGHHVAALQGPLHKQLTVAEMFVAGCWSAGASGASMMRFSMFYQASRCLLNLGCTVAQVVLQVVLQVVPPCSTVMLRLCCLVTAGACWSAGNWALLDKILTCHQASRCLLNLRCHLCTSCCNLRGHAALPTCGNTVMLRLCCLMRAS
jgi:hypothetical protein